MSIISLLITPFTESETATFTANGPAYDFALGGLPFLSAVSAETPFVIETAPYRKEQTDDARDVGEQSLVYWWLKSQSSFHGGAGQTYLDTPDNDDPLQRIRFADSLGVDVWTPGKVTLLKSAPGNLVKTGATQRLMTAVDGSTPVYFASSDATLTRSTGGASAAVTWGGTGTITSLTNDGTSYYAADSTGIYRGALTGGAGSLLWNTGGTTVVGWVKQRLVAGIGNKLYELTGTGPALPAAKYTHPNTSWRFTSIVEGPDAIYASGYAGGVSSVIRLTLDSQGVVPTLTSATTVAEMPPGETIRSLFIYLGSFMALGTSKGLRVAGLDSQGGVTYGPRIFDTTLPIRAMVGEDRYLYVGVSNGLAGQSGLYRVDLGTETGFGTYAYASDLQAKVTGEVSGVGLLGDQVVFQVEGSGVFLESATELETSGYLTTSRIRYGTVEPKLLKMVKVRNASLKGTLAVTYTDPADQTRPIATYAVEGDFDLDEASVNSGPVEYASLTFTLTRKGTDSTAGPEFRSYQLKALPAAKRQRLLQVPLLCFNNEKDRSGQRMGYLELAVDRLRALQGLEAAGQAVAFQQFQADKGETSELVVIDQMRFVQREGPTNQDGFGGVILLTLRTLE